MDPGIWHQVGLELGQIHIESTIKSEGSSDGRHNLANKPVQVGVSWPFNVQVATANVIDGLIVYHECTVRVLQGGMGGQDCL